MAGIGYELKQIFKEGSLTRLATGIAYSTIVTIGPTILVILTIASLYIILGLLSVSYYERELLSSTILYAFIFSLVLTAPFNGVMSRYIADKIYDEKYEDILPSFYMGIFLNIVVGAVFGIPFVYRLIFIGGVDAIFSFVSYMFFMALIINFYTMIYLSATKDYKIIAIFYVIGMSLSFILSVIFNKIGFSVINSILYGITIGFLTISILEFSYMKKYFIQNSRNYFECLSYFKIHKDIWISNLFYILGLYVHNFVFWSHRSHIVIAKTYVSMQNYDLASTLAMFTNISTIIIFTVMAETKFHTKYQTYDEAVIGKTLEQIEMAKDSMFKLLIQQISYILSIQFIITSSIFLLGILVFPRLGFSGSVIVIYPVLVASFLTIFMMYCNIIFMFYFNDTKGTKYTSVVFFLAVLIGSILSLGFTERFYGVGALVGAFIGWTFSFFRIKFIEKNFDEHIFCNIDMIDVKVGKKPSNVVYRRE